MNCMFANQESSSGCESGWTVYLEHSSINYSYDNINTNNNRENVDVYLDKVAKRFDGDDIEGGGGEEEDLSMVSDASSGPPHNNNQETGGCFHSYPAMEDPSRKSKTKKNSRDQKRRPKGQDDSVLDDTASSPFFDFSDKTIALTRNQLPSVENAVEYSQGYSSTQFEVRPQYHDFFQPTEPGNQMQQNQWFEGKSW